MNLVLDNRVGEYRILDSDINLDDTYNDDDFGQVDENPGIEGSSQLLKVSESSQDVHTDKSPFRVETKKSPI